MLLWITSGSLHFDLSFYRLIDRHRGRLFVTPRERNCE